MGNRFTRLSWNITDLLCRHADRIGGGLEAAIVSAFFTTALLSFPGLLNHPAAYAVTWAAGIWLWQRFTRFTTISAQGETGAIPYHTVITVFILGVIFLSFFLSPVSADGQRVKLARLILGV